MKKIEYQAPQMEVIKILSNVALLAGSIDEGGDIPKNPDPVEY